MKNQKIRLVALDTDSVDPEGARLQEEESLQRDLRDGWRVTQAVPMAVGGRSTFACAVIVLEREEPAPRGGYPS